MPETPADSLEERVRWNVAEHVEIVAHDPAWAQSFATEKAHLLTCLPAELIQRIEHFGSTAVPGLAAKPIVDMLVEVTDLESAKTRIAPILQAQGYDYYWRPNFGDDVPPWYAWFVKRDASGARTHHIHMIENTPEFAEFFDRLLFRDYLIAHPEVAREYAELKMRLSRDFPNDRVAYTEGKTKFIVDVTRLAKRDRSGEGEAPAEPFPS